MDSIKYISLIVSFLILIFIPIIVISIIVFLKYIFRFDDKKIYKEDIYKTKYEETTYYKITKNPYYALQNDAGKFGEFLIYHYLKNFENIGAKFLFNAYIPKENGETTEIDVLMLTSKGIFVFESKNYSGWIFGSEDNVNWYQTMGSARNPHKEVFYNPIMQNKSHIKNLTNLLEKQIPMYSVIVFSNRCMLKNVKTKSKNLGVVNCYNVGKVVSFIYDNIQGMWLSEADIDYIYNKLYPYTQLNEAEKIQHVVNIHNNSNSQNVKKTQIENIKINDELKCPLCCGNLIIRTAKKGDNIGNKFYGCSNFPKCRYTRKI